jgi:hypothetical protein
MFSLWVVVYMLVSGGREPFWDVNDIRTIRNTVRRDPSFNFSEFKNVSENAKIFIRGEENIVSNPIVMKKLSGLLEKHQRRRLTGEECLSHPWLEDGRHLVLSARTIHKLETIKMRRLVVFEYAKFRIYLFSSGSWQGTGGRRLSRRSR